jgi:hypothetical protein
MGVMGVIQGREGVVACGGNTNTRLLCLPVCLPPATCNAATATPSTSYCNVSFLSRVLLEASSATKFARNSPRQRAALLSFEVRKST